MASNSGLKHWSAADIAFLRAELKKGTRVKHIAACLNRSQTAVSKFAARHGFQTRRYTRRSGLERLYSAKIKRRPFKILPPMPIINKCDFVGFETILKYLLEKRHKISSKIPENIKLFYPDAKYLLDGQPVTRVKLLLLANKHRQDDGRDEFKVCEPLW